MSQTDDDDGVQMSEVEFSTFTESWQDSYLNAADTVQEYSNRLAGQGRECPHPERWLEPVLYQGREPDPDEWECDVCGTARRKAPLSKSKNSIEDIYVKLNLGAKFLPDWPTNEPTMRDMNYFEQLMQNYGSGGLQPYQQKWLSTGWSNIPSLAAAQSSTPLTVDHIRKIYEDLDILAGKTMVPFMKPEKDDKHA
jgi:hypothetical protein